MAERGQAALDQLLKTGLVDENKVAAIGFCFGGSASLALAYSGAPLAGVVTFHGGLIPAPADVAQKTKAKFLILHGALDPLVNKEAVDKFLKSMNDDKLDYQFIAYSGAVHAFSNPEADKAHAAGLDGVGYNAEAATRSWNQMKIFFGEIFGKYKPPLSRSSQPQPRPDFADRPRRRGRPSFSVIDDCRPTRFRGARKA